MKTTMASVPIINDITKPIDTSNWINFDKRKDLMTKEQKEAVKNMGKAVTWKTAPEDIDVDTAIQESMPWHEVKGKKGTKMSASQQKPAPAPKANNSINQATMSSSKKTGN
jgi:hypothetical protein